MSIFTLSQKNAFLEIFFSLDQRLDTYQSFKQIRQPKVYQSVCIFVWEHDENTYTKIMDLYQTLYRIRQSEVHLWVCLSKRNELERWIYMAMMPKLYICMKFWIKSETEVCACAYEYDIFKTQCAKSRKFALMHAKKNVDL